MPASKHDLIRLALESHREPGLDGKAKRFSPRFELDEASATCEVRQPGGSRNETEVILVDVSEYGAQVIYPGYLHTGTEFRLSLAIPNRPLVKAAGTSRWCRFLTGRYHAVGIRFSEPLRVRELIEPAAWMEACAAHPEFEEPIAGTMALYAEDDLSLDAMEFQLRTTQAERVRLCSRGALLDLLASGRVTALLLDCDGEESSVIELLSACRQRSFEGPVLLVSLDREASYAVDMDPLGRCRFVPKPMRNDALVGALRDIFREHPECVIHTSPIFSESPDSPDREEMLGSYIARCREILGEIEHELTQGRRESMLASLRSIAGSAGSYGFTPLADEALRCISVVSADAPAERLTAGLRGLGRVVDRLRATQEPKAAPNDAAKARRA